MAVLTQQQRNTLESAVKQARRISETGAYNALRALAVDNPEPFQHMNPAQRSLRNRLRNKARLLGDELPSSGKQQIDHIAYELAYEYWHKMLFAKFLEVNGLLMHPDGVSVTMEECEELAKEGNFTDMWDVAASFASKMLPAIFRPEDPLIQIKYSTDDRIKLEEILDSIDKYIFSTDDALGWVYQFWQSEAKDSINKSGEKINGEKLPAVTQLFTEPYMVHFLIDNTIGAWWISRHPGIKPPVSFDSLRLMDNGTPAAGEYTGWPGKTAEITTLDPCMGSGHFLVSLFNVFVRLRIFDEGLSKEEASEKVISENIHGLEIDPRCTQIAAFNLALAAWKFCGRHIELPEMNLACSGVAPKGKKDDWIKLVGKVEREDDKVRMKNGMAMLYDHFQLAPELGSLLEPTIIKADLHTASFDQLKPVLKQALDFEVDKDLIERGVVAAGIAKAGLLLSKKYTLQITNVPYLGKGKQDELLSDFALKNYPDAKADLATVFFEKLFKTAKQGGVVSCVIPQNWLFLTPYRNYRVKLLKNETWNIVARLGSGAFSQISGEVVKTILISLSHLTPIDNQYISCIEVSDEPNALTKANKIKTAEIKSINQKEQLGNPESRILLDPKSEVPLLDKYSYHNLGICTGDSIRFYRNFWELLNFKPDWDYIQSTVENTCNYGGMNNLVKWENGNGDLYNFVEEKLGKEKVGSWLRGHNAWGKKGVLVNAMSQSTTQYLGGFFDENTIVIIPSEEEFLIPLICYSKDVSFKKEIRKTNQAIKVRGDIIKIPFDFEYWKKIADVEYPNGLPKPYSDDPTQWIFHGNPIKTKYPIQVAVSRLLGYRWPAESDSNMDLSEDALKLSRNVKEFDKMSDDDGIVCIPSVSTEETGCDRLRNYIKEVFAKHWDNETIIHLLSAESAKSKNIENWIRNEFFVHHCKIFNNRPFIWHIWDGRNDGFSALVNYHKLDKENLSKLIYTYLGDWIRMCEAKKKSGESGADGLLDAALKLKEKLELILEGEAPYDIFVRWKPLEQQPIGWDPDLDDGVRLNIRPFIIADVLRKKPNIKWGIDRGKNPHGSPWGEIRDNDKHLTLAEKKKAREKT